MGDEEDLTPELIDARDLVLDLFTQACSTREGKYDHGFHGSYELAQEKLIEWGLIKPADCVYARKDI